MQYPYQKIAYSLISHVPPRAKDILVRRFGLENEEPETLEAIGGIHGITRERVRQIVDDGIAQIKERIEEKKERPALYEAFDFLSDQLKEEGHIKREDLFMSVLRVKMNQPVIFLLNLGDDFYKQRETEDFHSFWSNKKEVYEKAPDIVEGFIDYFEEKKTPLSAQELQELRELLAFFRELKLSSGSVPSFLEVSKHLSQGYDGRWGLRTWPEVNPKGIKDKAYLVFRTSGKPLHFMEVASLIRELHKKLPGRENQEVLPQTVHNELIKDPRFVLVGRGMYALAEWGYEPGTVKDVIMNILKSNGGTMPREEIIEKTLEQRKVRESTILLNLQDRISFGRDEQGNYFLIAQ